MGLFFRDNHFAIFVRTEQMRRNEEVPPHDGSLEGTGNFGIGTGCRGWDVAGTGRGIRGATLFSSFGLRICGTTRERSGVRGRIMVQRGTNERLLRPGQALKAIRP